ncbi:hypothetical protein KGA66_15185 [Actinocrinis puniceicyclus]|uniref:Polyketide cyclase / dehydrase and lipid transport n=1 Tax=Actinocrinis puniceicyclus TaxID=977794 RepID=A0A8J7WPD9_9ACTN|nr:hypothetical protein [Actinocrinis puniceicyclus]MBS2964400.1 hypothetical protein [Actinocrinis puniceicyclus]
METDLPFIDEHQVVVAAPAAVVWQSLTARIIKTRLGVSEAFARAVAARPSEATGTLLDEGSTMPGFAVAECVPGDHLTLVGSHRFSRYVLRFGLTEQPGGTVLSARSNAEFPGLPGRAYRQFVIGSGGHRVLVGRLLRSVARSAERRAAG